MREESGWVSALGRRHRNGWMKGAALAYKFILSKVMHAPDKDLQLKLQG